MPQKNPESMADWREFIERDRNALLSLVESLSPQDRDEKLDPAGWSAKDHVIHLAFWERSMVYLLSKRPRHEGLGVEQDVYLGHDVDTINDVIYRQNRERSWSSVREVFDQVHVELMETLDGLSWGDLHLTYSHYAPDEPGEERGVPVAYYVAGNTYGHYDEHRGWIEELFRQDA